MKVVLDTNVLLAGLGTHGLCEAVVVACLEDHEMVLSTAILKELRHHLTNKFKMPARQASQRAAFMREHATMVKPAVVGKSACRDPDDLAILGTAIAGEVDCLVTGDSHLLELGSYRDIPIISPRAFYEQIR